MRFSLVNVGCKVNRVEIDDIAVRLMGQGAVPVDDGTADLVVVNTCTVTAEADKKTRKGVRHALKENPLATVLVTGCAAVMDPLKFERMNPRVHVVAKAHVPDAAWNLAGEHPAAFDCPLDLMAEDGMAKAQEVPLRFGAGFRNRVGIKIQDGCDNACTYCIVHVARGHSTSVAARQIESEARRYIDAGAHELILTGINLGAYRDGATDLAALTAALSSLSSAARLRLSSIEPLDVSDRLIEVISQADGRVCRHMHLPLQSGSSRVLHDMARPYDAEAYLALVERMRASIPQLSLSTDIIVGFPGETDEDFEATLAVARAARFSKIHVFRYSKREGTPAASRVDQVEPALIVQRSKRLIEVGDALRLEDAKRRLGTRESVLVENAAYGTSESYHPVHFGENRYEEGALIEFSLTDISPDGIFLL